MSHSFITAAVTRDGSARILFTDSTQIVAKAARIHKLSRTAMAALGRSLTAASLMGFMLKDNNTLTLRIKGDGPGGTILCVSDSEGNVRGYIDNPQAELSPNDKGKIDVAGLVGRGLLCVIKDLGLENPYIGTSPIVSGEIAEDITEYFSRSEQIPTICALGVRVNPNGGTKAAGGLLLQLLPYADKNIISVLEKNISGLDNISALIAEKKSAEQIIETILAGIEFDLFEPRRTEYKCPCTKERYEQALISLGKEELEQLIAENEPVETCCQFCGKTYIFTIEEIKTLLKKALH